MKSALRFAVFCLLTIWATINIVMIFAPAGFISTEGLLLFLAGLFSSWLEFQAFRFFSSKGLTYEKYEDIKNEEV